MHGVDALTVLIIVGFVVAVIFGHMAAYPSKKDDD